jgi:DNA-binding NarL/FixJ family response regulator
MCHCLPQPQSAPQSREQELEAQASELLRASAQSNAVHEYPFYISESTLRQVSAREKALSGHEFFGPARPQARSIALLEALCEQLDLTQSQRQILELTRQGYTKAEIAESLDLTPKAIGRRQDRIIARLRHAASVSRGRLLLETYEEQLEQHRYQPEQHCAPGREACRRDGKCRYRWYLYAIVAEQQAE